MGNMNYNKHRVSINSRSLIDAGGVYWKFYATLELIARRP